MQRAHQIPLDFNLHYEMTFANFYGKKSQQLLHLLRSIAEQNSREQFVYIWGEAGLGCSHLLQAVCHQANLYHYRTAYIPLQWLNDLSPVIFEGLEHYNIVCIDDLDALAQNSPWEEALFHLYNRIKETQNCLIVGAHQPPGKLRIKLADLVSRLQWGIVHQLNHLTDKELIEVLQLRAQNNGLEMSQEVGEYLIRRFPRKLPVLLPLLMQLERASMAAQRKLTIPFLKEVVEREEIKL